MAGACLLLPTIWLLWSLAYGSSVSPGISVVVTLLLVCGVVCSGPAAWLVGNEARASGTLTPKQARKIGTERIYGMIGPGLLGVEALIYVFLLIS